MAWPALTNCGPGNAGNGVRGSQRTINRNLEQPKPGYWRQERRGDSDLESLLSVAITLTKGNNCHK